MVYYETVTDRNGKCIDIRLDKEQGEWTVCLAVLFNNYEHTRRQAVFSTIEGAKNWIRANLTLKGDSEESYWAIGGGGMGHNYDRLKLEIKKVKGLHGR